MRKLFFCCLCAGFLGIHSNAAFAQENFPVVKNLFDSVRIDTAKFLWTFKKTDDIRINVVKMQGEGRRHKHPDADHTILVIKGVINAEIGGKKLVLHEGDMISIPAGMPHKYTVEGKQAIIVSMDAPYYDPAKTIMLE